jgi:hypothetical protein
MLRKHTKFQTCERHGGLMSERPGRRAEFFVEGGPAGEEGCLNGLCRLWPGTDRFDPSICHGEYELDWTRQEIHA